MELRSTALGDAAPSPTRSLVGVLEVVLIVAALVGLRWVVTTLGLSVSVVETLHRVAFLGAAAVGAHHAMRYTGDFAWRTVAVTALLVAAALAALIALGAGQWLLAVVVALAVVAGALAAAGSDLDWWGGTHTALALLIVGLLPVFLALDPTVALPAAEGGPPAGATLEEWLAAVPRPPVLAGGALFVLGRSFA